MKAVKWYTLTMPLLNHFDFLAPFYEAFIKPQRPEKLLELAALPTEGILLDAGGGTGRTTQFLCGMATGLIVADLSSPMLKEARKKAGLRPVRSYIENLPFPDSSFVRVIMVDALHHMNNQRKVAQELWRILQPGGRIIIEEPDIRIFTVKLVALAENLALMRSRFLNADQVADLFQYTNARTQVKTGKLNIWVIVEKTP